MHRNPLPALRAVIIALIAAVSPLVAQPSCLPAPEGLIAWWDAAPNAASRAVDLVGVTDALLQNGTQFAAAPGFSSEVFAFDGINDHLVSTAEMPELDGTFTFEGWVRPTRFSGFQGLVSKFEPAGEQEADFALLLNPAGLLQVRFVTNAIEVIVQGRTALALGQFNHVAVTLTDGGAVSITVNGIDQVLDTVPQSASFGAFPVGSIARSTFVGCVRPGLGHFEGEMDELSFYDRELNLSEVQAIEAAGSAFKCKAAPLPAGAITWLDGELCRDHALDRIGLDVCSLVPRTQTTVVAADGRVGAGFDFRNGGGLDFQRPILRTTGPFSIEMWIFRTRFNSSEVLYAELNRPGVAVGETLLTLQDGGVRFRRNTGNGNQTLDFTGVLRPRLGEWTHIAAVFGGGNDIRLYVNGQRDAGRGTQPRLTTLNASNTASSGFGVAVIQLSRFRGRMDECTLYRSALTDAEVQAIFGAGSFGKLAPSTPGVACRVGTNEDLELTITPFGQPSYSPPSIQFAAGESFFLDMRTPFGTFALKPYGILAQPYQAATPPTGLPGFSTFAVDLASSFFAAGGLTPTRFGLPMLSPNGSSIVLTVPVQLAGERVRLQGFALDPLAANGVFASTDPIDLQIRSSGAGPIGP